MQAKVASAEVQVRQELRDIGDDARDQAHKYLEAKIYSQGKRWGYQRTNNLRKSTRVDDSGLSDFTISVQTGAGYAPYAEYVERGPGGDFGASKPFPHAGDLSYMWPTFLDFTEGRGRESVKDRIRDAVERS